MRILSSLSNRIFLACTLLATTAHGVLQMVSVPIQLDPAEVLGRLTIGFILDDGLAQQFKELTGSDIAFGAHGQVLASTLPPESHAALRALMDAGGISTVTIGNDE